MSSIVIAGDTSGSVTLQAPAVAGATILTLPATSGTVQTSGGGYTTNGVAFASSTSVLATGSALSFNGTLLQNDQSSAASGLMLNLQNTSTGSLIQFAMPGVANVRFGSPNADAFVWQTFGGGAYPEQMRLTSTGLGIGTTSPGARLDVDGSIIGQAVLTLNSANTPTLSQGSNKINLTGAGTSLDGIYMANDGGTFVIAMEGSSGNQAVSATPYASGMRTIGATPLVFGTNNAERARIDSSGNFLVNSGQTNLVGGLSVGTSSLQGSVIYFGTSVIAAGAGTYPLKWNSSTGVVTYDTSSRLVKENIEDSPYGLAEVLQLKSRKYYRTDDQRNEIGLVADEVQTVMPEFVPLVEKSIFTKDAADTEIIAGGVNYDKLTSVLVKAIQELKAELDAYKASHP